MNLLKVQHINTDMRGIAFDLWLARVIIRWGYGAGGGHALFLHRIGSKGHLGFDGRWGWRIKRGPGHLEIWGQVSDRFHVNIIPRHG